jgi:hypothetical protein
LIDTEFFCLHDPYLIVSVNDTTAASCGVYVTLSWMNGNGLVWDLPEGTVLVDDSMAMASLGSAVHRWGQKGSLLPLTSADLPTAASHGVHVALSCEGGGPVWDLPSMEGTVLVDDTKEALMPML